MKQLFAGVLDSITPQLGLHRDWDTLHDFMTLSIPFAGHSLSWHAFISQRFLDFLFVNEEAFQPLCGSLSSEERAHLVSQLQQWKDAAKKGPEAMRASMLSILGALLTGYNSWQRARVSALGIERLQFELSCSSAEVVPDLESIPEVLLVHSPGEGRSMAPKACFGIPVVVDLAGVEQAASHLQQPVEVRGVFKLCLAYPAVAGNPEPERQLQVPQCLEGALPPIPLPSWSSHMCQIEYIPLVAERCQAVVDAFSLALSLQAQLLHALVEKLGGPLDFNVFQGSALWTMAWEGVPMLLSIQANGNAYGQQQSKSSSVPPTPGKMLPEQMPVLTLTSVRHPDVTQTFTEYPWSPRWPPHQMASRILSFLSNVMPAFVGRGPSATPAAASSVAAATPL